MLSVPMLKEGKLVGAFNLFRQEVRPFTDKQVELVKNFAAQAVIAIENTRLLNELRHRTDDLSRRWTTDRDSEVLKVISSSASDLRPVFRSMLENSVRILRGKIWSDVFCARATKFRVVALTRCTSGHLFREDLNGVVHSSRRLKAGSHGEPSSPNTYYTYRMIISSNSLQIRWLHWAVRDHTFAVTNVEGERTRLC